MGQVLISNKKAFRDYFLDGMWECGLELKGMEVKSLRDGGANFADSFARIEGSQIILHNLHINPYQQASYMNVEPARPRRLLLHKREIKKITSRMLGTSLALIPTKIYFNARGFAKIEIALGKGKRLYDKREAVKKKALDRQIARTIRTRRT
ncbi:MAG: SsrA-binding protein SmpB [Candidatus Omnitrophica bacterium]|nr:SsrA-binding protein SmpB [Candidatus Omnitrophota bacterium]